MPVYHFHHWQGEQLTEDLEGVACLSLEAAHKRAIYSARDVLAGEARDGRIDLNQRLELVDDAGRLCLTVRFSDVVEIIGPVMTAAQTTTSRSAQA